MRRGVCGLFAVVAAGLIVPAAGADVLRVGSYNGIPGQYSSIQAAVNAARVAAVKRHLRPDRGYARFERAVCQRYLERITVRGHHEFVRFARIYHRC